MELSFKKQKKAKPKNLIKLKRMVWETTYQIIYPVEKIDCYDFEKKNKTLKF